MKKITTCSFWVATAISLFVSISVCVGIINTRSAMAQDMIQVADNTFTIQAKKIEIVSRYVPSSSANVDAVMKPSPKIMIEDWLNRTFKVTATGSDILRFTIKDASVTESEQKSGSWFESDLLKYTASFNVHLAIIDENGKVLASAVTKAWGTRSISDNTSIEEREKLVSEMADTLLQSLADRITTEIQTGFYKYLK